MAVAGAAQGRGQARRPAQHRRRARADLLGQVRPLLRRRAAPGPLEDGATGLRPHQLRAYVDENTIGVVAILGVTFTCDYEPVAEIAAELDRIQEETGLDVPIHVDAASGGFVAPFLHQDLVWDFRLERVSSINASGHKYGLAPLGVGWAVWRTADLLPKDLVFDVTYLGGDLPTFALNFSRPGGEIVAQYYNFLRLGRPATGASRGVRGDGPVPGRAGGGDGPVHPAVRRAGALPAVSYTLTDPAGRASACTTSPTSSGCAAGRSPRTRCPPTGRRP